MDHSFQFISYRIHKNIKAMKKRIAFLSVLWVLLLTTNCATIVSDKTYNVSFSSAPSKANLEIIDRSGATIFKGTTPVNLNLSAKQGYFEKAVYTIRFTKEGYDDIVVPLTASLDGWYFGNLLFGGIIGFLIVDPLSGAMYKLDQQFVNVSLNQTTSAIDQNGLQVLQLKDVPRQWLAHLERIH